MVCFSAYVRGFLALKNPEGLDGYKHVFNLLCAAIPDSYRSIFVLTSQTVVR